MAALSPTALREIVNERAYQWYQIRDAKGEALLDGSHTAGADSLAEDGAAAPRTAPDLGSQIETALTRFGAGNYQVHLKKHPNSKVDGLVKLPVVVPHEGGAASLAGLGALPAAPYGLGMISQDEAESRTQRAVAEALRQFQQQTEQQRQMEELRRELRETKNAGMPSGLMDGLTNALMVAMVAVVAKVAPEALPAVQMALSAQSAPEPISNTAPGGLVE